MTRVSKPTKATEAEQARVAAASALLPSRIVDAAALLNIGPLFAMTLAQAGRLPGVAMLSGEWQINMVEINGAIYDLSYMMNNPRDWHTPIDPKWGLDRDEVPDIPPVPELGFPETWPHWMAGAYCCGACNHDGRFNPLTYKQPCYGWEPSRFMRSESWDIK